MIKMEVSKKNEQKLELTPEDVLPIIGFSGEEGQKRFTVLEFITLNGPITNYSLATELHLHISTTHRIIKDLLSRRMIELYKEEKHWSGTTKKFYGPTQLGLSCSLASKEVDSKFKEVLPKWSRVVPESEYLKKDQVITAYKTVIKSKVKTLSRMMTGKPLTAEQVSEQPGVAFFLAGMFSSFVVGDEVGNAMKVLYECVPPDKNQIIMEAGVFLEVINKRFPGIMKELRKNFPILFKKSK